MVLIDSHCHIHFSAFKSDRDEVIARCIEKDIILNTVGTFKGTSKRAVELAEQYDNIYATIGLHPTHIFPMDVHGDDYDFISKAEDFDEEFYAELVTSEKVIAIGETGIDLFHMPKGFTREEILEKQKNILLQHARFANRHKLPLVIHCRNAYDELIDFIEILVTNYKLSVAGVVHCFSGDWKQAKELLDAGLYLGFTGVVTFPPKKTDPKQQEDLLEVIEKCPLDRILVETDAPYLAPQKYRGKRSEPWMTEEVVKKIAEIKGIRIKEIKNRVYENTRRLFFKIK